MKLRVNIIALTILFACQSKSQNRVAVNIPSADSESEYIWQTLQDIKFFEENNYQVSLPKSPFIEGLKVKSKASSLTNQDYEKLKSFIQDSVYNESDYQKGYEKIKNELGLINKMIREIGQLNLKWIFKEYDTYKVNLTLFGPGGSYNPDQGTILIFTTKNGQFKSYDNPVNTIIHEITHIGIEESIVNNYDVPHTLKERIVDTFVFLNFKAYLPHYRIQDMGENRTDQYLKTKADLDELGKFVKMIMEED